MTRNNTIWRTPLTAAAFAFACLLPAGCGKENGAAFHAINVTGADYARNWSMPDTRGRERTLGEFAGKVVYVFFGFTHCPDVCPTTMATMLEVKKRLGKNADKLQVIFVTVDPDRDTPEVLRAYVSMFDSNTIALAGNPERLARMAKEFKVVYQKVPGPSAGTYRVDHSAGAYIYDTRGKLRLYSKYGMPIEDLTADIRKLIQGT